MAYNAAKAASNKRSDAKYMQILLKPRKEDGERIRAAAAAAGESLQKYVLTAVDMRMRHDAETTEN